MHNPIPIEGQTMATHVRDTLFNP